MQWECLRLRFAECVHELSVHCWTSPPSSVGTIFVVVPIPSAHVSSLFNLDIEQLRSIKESGLITVRQSKSQVMPPSCPFMSLCAGSSHSRFALLVHYCTTTTTAAPGSPIQCLVPIQLLVMVSMVTPSSPMQSPTVGYNVQTTS